VDNSQILVESDPNKPYNLLMNNYGKIFNDCFPLKQVNKKRATNPWFDQERFELMKSKDKLYKKYISNRTSRSKALYNRARNIYYHNFEVKKKLFFVAHFEKHKIIQKKLGNQLIKYLEKINYLNINHF